MDHLSWTWIATLSAVFLTGAFCAWKNPRLRWPRVLIVMPVLSLLALCIGYPDVARVNLITGLALAWPAAASGEQS